jgi:hypothetical protein
LSRQKLEKLKIHASETAWVGSDIDYNVSNDTTIDDLFSQIKQIFTGELSQDVKISLDLI